MMLSMEIYFEKVDILTVHQVINIGMCMVEYYQFESWSVFIATPTRQTW